MSMVLLSWQLLSQEILGSFGECSTAPCGCQPVYQTDQLEPIDLLILGSYSDYIYHCHLLLLLIFTIVAHFTEDRSLSRPKWLVTYRDGLPVHMQSPL